MNSFPSNSSNSAMDNFLVESLMDRLQVRNPVNNPLVTRSLEDYLYHYGDFEHEEDDREIIPYQEGREELIMEEKRLEQEIVNIIVDGKGDSLMPNTGEAVYVLGHSISISYEEVDRDDCMVWEWEWHGHITDPSGTTIEYIYGGYSQMMKTKKKEEEQERGQGLKDLIDEAEDSRAGRILHRSLNARSTRRY